ncbi:proteoglycan [Pimephales promelas]|nr:proteoglycan [Pimephales promelas]
MATYLSLLLLFACASTSSSNPNSCKGRCGEGYYRGSLCQCDHECLGLNECCTDFIDLCTTKDSCKGRCGEPFNRGNPCHCDIDCVPYKQCCPDYEGMCLMEESSNEEMTNEDGIGDELMIPEDESESIPSEGSDADASSMLPADENPIGSTTQQPSEMTTSSTPQPQENASTAPTEGQTSTAPNEGPTSTAPTQGPTSTAPTEGPRSTAPTDGPTKAVPTEGPTSAIPSNGPASTAPKEYSVTEMSLMDSRATSVPKTASTPAPVKPTKRTIQPSTHKNDKSDSIKDYQADDYDTNLCSGRPVSGLTTLKNGTIVVFRGHYFWTLDKYRNPDPPQLITRVWGIPSPIDTVYTRCNCMGKTYFFKGKDYWRFDNGVMDHGFPKLVSQGFGQIGHITAALSIPEYRSRKESVIFFKRGGLAQKYTYQITPSCGKRTPVYPARTRARRQAAAALGHMINISKNWKGFPTMVTSAVSVPSRVKEGYKYYVFSQRKYYSIKMEREKPVILKPATGPKENSASSFFKCQETQKN